MESEAPGAAAPTTVTPHAPGEPLHPFRALADGWRSFVANPWLSLAVLLVLWVVYLVIACIPFMNLLGTLLVCPALIAGGAGFLLRSARGQNPQFESAFDGFKRWPSVTGAILVVQLVALACVIPMLAAMLGAVGLGVLLDPRRASEAVTSHALTAALGPVLVLMPVLYGLLLWWGCRMMPVYFVVMEPDRPSAGEALKRAWALTRGSTWRVLGVLLLGLLVAMVGLLALCVGIIPAVAVTYYMLAQAYEQLRARAAAPPAAAEPAVPVVT